MIDFDRARQIMVDGQLRAGGVFETRLISEMGRLPRERFVPEARRDLAYVDDLHWFDRPPAGRFMPAPAILAKLIQLAEIAPSDDVLDIGATTGYATAVMAGLAASVTGLEPDAGLAERATANLAVQQIGNARVISGGLEKFSPSAFDVIMAEGMIDTVPPLWLHLLRPGGRIVALLRNGPIGTAHVYVSADGKVTQRSTFNASLPLLPGHEVVKEFEL
ncbi:MAG: protein-L-isoaspartate O-methyltransferase [Candidatus Devosia phytovorans]|uniref:Protein-L-isoaspartate O-methyltransferase n=1 Tax=Candidatus Devosia phytovorans TaxID=3121372 RepID=A0AAJ6B138_9HYPH|nr:protein-L-isoaspartate O-methyltransferase [Devosia sp.]WEK06350.1 MAG: protein-L-isoaspartate O-methyltransferase [Devosia sp.]